MNPDAKLFESSHAADCVIQRMQGCTFTRADAIRIAEALGECIAPSPEHERVAVVVGLFSKRIDTPYTV
jgi:hypothetical protein